MHSQFFAILAVLKKNWTDYEQILSSVFSCFHGQKINEYFLKHCSVRTEKLDKIGQKKLLQNPFLKLNVFPIKNNGFEKFCFKTKLIFPNNVCIFRNPICPIIYHQACGSLHDFAKIYQIQRHHRPVGKLAHPKFGSSVNPIPTRGADYAHHITACPPGFENLAASLQYYM